MSPSAVVVGAGLSGLTAAHRLQQAGFEVTVLEREAGPGGRAQSEERDGYLVDTGPDALTESYTSYIGLLNEVGLGDRLAPASPVAGLIRDGRVIDIDPRKPLSLIRNPMLSMQAKLAVLRGFLRLRKQIATVDSFEFVRSAHLDDPADDAYAFGVRHFGQEAGDYLIDPMIRLFTGSSSKESSALTVLGALGSWTSPIVNVRGGLGLLPRVLAEKVDVRYLAHVTGIKDSADGVRVDYTDVRGSRQSLDAGVCVIGAMYHVARAIWMPLDIAAPGFGSELRNVKLVAVSLGYAAATKSRAYAIQVPTVEDEDALLIFLQHHKAPDRAPAGHSLITIYTDTLAYERYAESSDEVIVQWASDTIERLFPELAGKRDMGCVTRWSHAGYLSTPGSWPRTRALLDALPEDGRVQLAGDLFGAGSMESSVRWGERAAARLVEHHGAGVAAQAAGR